MLTWLVKCKLEGEMHTSPELSLQRHEDGKRLVRTINRVCE